MAENTEKKELYDWEKEDDELSEGDTYGWPEIKLIIKATVASILIVIAAMMAVAVVANYLGGPRTYFISYSYSFDRGVIDGFGKATVQFGGKVDTSNVSYFFYNATDAIISGSDFLSRLDAVPGKDLTIVILNYQEVPRTFISLLHF